MANQEHLDILAKGVGVWNEWRKKNSQVNPDLNDARLIGADLTTANFDGVDLRGADLSDTNLSDADLSRADLSDARMGRTNLMNAYLFKADLRSTHLVGAQMSRTDLQNANMQGADLSGSNLSGAGLWGAELSGANIRGVNFSGANLRGAGFHEARAGSTLFVDVDLRTVVGLESVHHKGPSSVSLDTIYRSKGQIPESFLRGCGVPENFVAFMKSLTGAALEFYSVFISYSTKDQPFADRLHADLQAKGVRCWFAPHDIQGGKKIHEQIDEAIRVYDKLLLILSDASMNSNWVKTEIANARAREQQQNRQMLFPITLVPFDGVRGWKCFDADSGIDSAREIREYFIPDFSNWKDHDLYAAAFDRLVRDLKAGPGDRAEARRSYDAAGPIG